MAEQAGRFVGVSASTCALPGYDELPRATQDVRDVAAGLAPALDPLVVEDAAINDVPNVLAAVAAGGRQVGSLVVLWSGHAATSAGTLRLLPVDATSTTAHGRDAKDLVEACALSGASQVLVILDACFSGQATPDAVRTALAAFEQRPPSAPHVWFGFLTACQRFEQARDGRLGQLLVKLLTTGPAAGNAASLTLDWPTTQPLIRGSVLLDAIAAEWADDEQTPLPASFGLALPMLPNPRYTPGPPRVVEHLLQAARGGATATELSAFTGRREEVDLVVEWVRSRRPGLRVVTGPAGTGKSAIVGRVVSVADAGSIERQGERQRLQDEPGFSGWGHADPGRGAVDAHAHARGLTADRLAVLLAAGLQASGHLGPSEPVESATDLVSRLGARSGTPGWNTPVIVIDGLDEARGEVFDIAGSMLGPLSAVATVVVATREVPGPEDEPSLLERLAPRGPDLDLGTPEARDRTRATIAAYVRTRLATLHAVTDVEVLAKHVAEVAGSDEVPFLLARVLSDQLLAAPVDTRHSGWESAISGSLAAAVETDLARIDAPSTATDSHRRARGRRLLTALTWGLGAGFPEDEWLAVANTVPAKEVDGATATEDSGDGPLDRDDLIWLLDSAGRYVVQDGEDGIAVYRIAHQAVADRLRPPFVESSERIFDPEALVICRALSQRYAELLDSELPPERAGYLWRYLARHAAAAGPSGIDLLRPRTAQAPALLPDFANAALAIANQLAFWGQHVQALPFTDEAVTVRQDLAATNPAYLPDLASALNNLGVRYRGVGDHVAAVRPSEEARNAFQNLAATNPDFLPDLATSSTNLGRSYTELGRHEEALEAVELAVDILNQQDASIAHLASLGDSLKILGIIYAKVGRLSDAVGVSETCALVLRELVAINPNHLPDLASALNNLANRYRGQWRLHEALDTIREAVKIYEDLARTNPAHLSDLTTARNGLTLVNSLLARLLAAVAATEEAVTTHRQLTTTSPANLPALARDLVRLGAFYRGVGRRQDAVAPTEEAVTLYRELAADNPAYDPDLARALNNLGICFSEVGRRQDAVAPTEEAASLYRDLAADNPAYLPDLAGTLNNLGIWYSEVGRRAEALAPTEEAVTLRRDLAVEYPDAFTEQLRWSEDT